MRAGGGEMQETVMIGFTPWCHASRAGPASAGRPRVGLMIAQPESGQAAALARAVRERSSAAQRS